MVLALVFKDKKPFTIYLHSKCSKIRQNIIIYNKITTLSYYTNPENSYPPLSLTSYEIK